jgi:hypothetical protein
MKYKKLKNAQEHEMKTKITLNDINAFGEAWKQVKEKTYGKLTMQAYRQLRPFIELTDDYRHSIQNYIREHAADGEQRILRYDHTDQNGEQMSDEMCERLGLPETDEWRAYQQYQNDLVFEEHEIEVTPVMNDKELSKLNPSQIRVFDRLGLIQEPKSENEEEGE